MAKAKYAHVINPEVLHPEEEGLSKEVLSKRRKTQVVLYGRYRGNWKRDGKTPLEFKDWLNKVWYNERGC